VDGRCFYSEVRSCPTHLEGSVGEEGELVPLEEPLAGVLKSRLGDGLGQR